MCIYNIIAQFNRNIRNNASVGVQQLQADDLAALLLVFDERAL